MIKLLNTIALSLLIALPLAQAQVNFTYKPFELVLAQAGSEKKYVMVDAYTDWCSWCKVMDRETFSDPVAGTFVNERLITTKINMEEGFGIDLAMKYRVSSYPQYLFFDSDGNLIGRLAGFMKTTPFISAVTQKLDPRNFLPKSPAPLNFTEGYPEFLRNSFKKNKERTNPTAAEVETFLAAQEDLTSEASWGVIHRFVGGGDYGLKAIQNRDILIAKYGKEEVNDKFASYVFTEVKTAIKDKDEAHLNQALAMAGDILGEDAPMYQARYRLYYFQMTENWEAYFVAAKMIAANEEINDPGTLNAMAWKVYENSDEPAMWESAISWMAQAVKEDPQYAHLDTYAALLYKSGQKEKALEMAERALEAGLSENREITETQNLIEKIKAL